MLRTTHLVKKSLLLATAAGSAVAGPATQARACDHGGRGYVRTAPVSYAAPVAYAQPYAPRPVAYQPPVYQQPAYQPPVYAQPTYQPAAPQPVAYQPPASPPPPAPAPATASQAPTNQIPGAASGGSGVILMADKNLGGSVNYTLDGGTYQMGPGQTQKLDGSKAWTIRFDRGGSFGQAEYGLSAGAYEWTITDRGWDLRSKTFAVTLDNTQNTNEFNFVASDRQEVVPAGQSKRIASKLPVVITFDRGDGREPARKELGSGTFRVGVDRATNLVEVFAGSSSSPDIAQQSISAPASDNTLPIPPPAPEPALTMSLGR